MFEKHKPDLVKIETETASNYAVKFGLFRDKKKETLAARIGELEAEEAVYRAECFIIQNGYTDLPPLADKSQITLEDIYTLTVEEGMAMRRDLLERRAFSYRRDNDFYGGSWVIMFRYKSHPNMMKFYGEERNHIGRAVVMNFFGRHVRIQHSSIPTIRSRCPMQKSLILRLQIG